LIVHSRRSCAHRTRLHSLSFALLAFAAAGCLGAGGSDQSEVDVTDARPDVTPRPIGVGPRYLPAPAPPRIVRGEAVGSLRCTRNRERRYGVHVEVFAHRKVVIVPAGIGVAAPFVRSFGSVAPRGCTYPLRTLTPTGVVEIRSGAGLVLGDLFRIWGKALGRHELAGFRSTRPVLAFVAGRRWRGDPGQIPLRRHAQIVLEIDGYVPPHPRFLFPKGL
jgi:hypothetical protein